MPYLSIQTNLSLAPAVQQTLLESASSVVAEILSKPEDYVMVAVNSPVAMAFGGTTEPTAFLELKSIGLPESETPSLSRALCQLISDVLDIPPNRVFIVFSDTPRQLWGWDNKTF